MKKISIRKRIKETMALLLGALMVFITIGSPLSANALDHSYSIEDGLDALAGNGYFM